MDLKIKHRSKLLPKNRQACTLIGAIDFRFAYYAMHKLACQIGINGNIMQVYISLMCTLD